MMHQQSMPPLLLTTERQRILRFLLVGLSSTLLDFMLLLVFKTGGASTLVANSLAYSLATVYNFTVSRQWTYAGTRHKPVGIQFTQYALASLLQLVLNDAVVVMLEAPLRALLADGAWSYLPAKVVATVVVAVVSYLANRMWIFGDVR